MRHLAKKFNHIQDSKEIFAKDEPVFILSASDRLAPEIFSKWIDYMECETSANQQTILAAKQHLELIINWQQENKTKLLTI